MNSGGLLCQSNTQFVSEIAMHRTPLSFPEIGLIAGTRAALGAGIALLLADRLNDDQRRGVGWTLVAVGAITTVPIVIQLLSEQRALPEIGETSPRRRTEHQFAS
jgi:hypothetical protein